MKLKLFALNATKEFGQTVAKHLGVPLSEHEERYFADGECYVAPRATIKENCRGQDVFVIQSLYSDENEDVNQKIMKTIVFLGALRDASAGRVTLVAPYYPYARQDRKTASRAPITTKYIARLFKKMWVNRILTMDIHSPTAIQNYPISCDILEARNLFVQFVRSLVDISKEDEIVVMSPDEGGLKRSGRVFRDTLNQSLGIKVGLACLDKVHIGDQINRGIDVMGDIAGKAVVIHDDMFSSGKSVHECVSACMEKQAKYVLTACATHGLFVGKANDFFDCAFIKKIAVTDTVRPFRLNQQIKEKLSIIKTTTLFAEAIKRIHCDESISDLINNHFHSSTS